MNCRTLILAAVGFGLTCAPFAAEGPAIGEAAPGFTLNDHAGRAVSLADFAGKTVVLEWINPECPFVVRHYKAETMKKLAVEWAERNVVWLAVNSTSHMPPAGSAEWVETYELPFPILVDQPGEVGHLYGAQTTPHMYIICPEGKLAYRGAIDDDPRGNKDEVHNYVAAALADMAAGRPVATPETKPYGCTVKYPK